MIQQYGLEKIIERGELFQGTTCVKGGARKEREGGGVKKKSRTWVPTKYPVRRAPYLG